MTESVADPGATLGDGSLKMALVHEWLDAPGGAENVLKEMLRVYPQADVWSLWCLSPAREQIPVAVQTSWLDKTALAGHKRAALPMMPFAWRMLGRRDYDAVITSSYAFAHLARFRGNVGPTLHYIHTPARYWWTPDVDDRASSRFAALPRAGLRVMDRRAARNHKNVAANSKATQDRIARFWDLESQVIYPPVATDFYTPGSPESDLPFPEYILGASRWIPYKRLDLVIATAARARVPVVIAGSGPIEAQLRALAAAVDVPVYFEVQPTRQRLRDLYRGAMALVFPVHEDFGIVPVEALAAGTPVVGPNIGGLSETVIDGVTGRLVDRRVNTAELAVAVRSVSGLGGPALADHARRFSAETFRRSIADWVGRAVRDA
ncbi:MAG: glycosyltransferase [Actinomycetes bacterium]